MFTRRNQLTTLIVFTAVSMVACLSYADPQRGKGGEKGSNGVETHAAVTVSAGITIGEARLLASRHGLTGAKPLPPGIRKNLARGKPLPPGIRNTRLPTAFIADLPHHDGFEWHIAGTALVLVGSVGLEISVILEGVFD